MNNKKKYGDTPFYDSVHLYQYKKPKGVMPIQKTTVPDVTDNKIKQNNMEVKT